MNISEAVKSITGKQISPEDMQRMESIQYNLDIPKGDALVAVLCVLDAYYGVFSRLPSELNKAADNAASSAASKAQSAVNEAVAKLLPTISKDISKQTNEAIETVQKNQSLKIKGLWFSVIAAGVLCLFFGGRYAGLKQAKAEIRAQDNAELVWLHSEVGQALSRCNSKYLQLRADGWCYAVNGFRWVPNKN